METQRFRFSTNEPSIKWWLESYFAPGAGHTDRLLIRNEVWQQFQEEVSSNIRMSPIGFKMHIMNYCLDMGYVFNPPGLVNGPDNRIIKTIDYAGQGRATELFYVRTRTDGYVDETLPTPTINLLLPKAFKNEELYKSLTRYRLFKDGVLSVKALEDAIPHLDHELKRWPTMEAERLSWLNEFHKTEVIEHLDAEDRAILTADKESEVTNG